LEALGDASGDASDTGSRGPEEWLESRRRLSGQEVRDITGIDKKTFNQLIARKIINTCGRDKRNWTLYPYESIEAIQRYLGTRHIGRAKNSGEGQPTLPPVVEYSVEEGMMVFERLQRGVLPTAIFLETRIHPTVIQRIAQDFINMSGGIVIPQSILDKMNILQLEGPFPISCPDDLLEVLERAARERRCRTCKKNTCSSMCTPCVTKATLADLEKKMDQQNDEKENARVMRSSSGPRPPRSPAP